MVFFVRHFFSPLNLFLYHISFKRKFAWLHHYPLCFGDHYKNTLGIVFHRLCFCYRLQEKFWEEAIRMTHADRLVAAVYHNNSSPPFLGKQIKICSSNIYSNGQHSIQRKGTLYWIKTNHLSNGTTVTENCKIFFFHKHIKCLPPSWIISMFSFMFGK